MEGGKVVLLQSQRGGERLQRDHGPADFSIDVCRQRPGDLSDPLLDGVLIEIGDLSECEDGQRRERQRERYGEKNEVGT